MSTGLRRGQRISQAKQDARMRRKRGLPPQEASPLSMVDKTEQLHASSPQKVSDALATILVSSSPPSKQQKVDDAPSLLDVEMRFPSYFLHLSKKDHPPMFLQLNQLLFPCSREHLVGTSTLDIVLEAASVHIYCLQNSLVLRDRVIGLAKEMKRLDDVAKSQEAKMKTATRQFITVKKELDEAKLKVEGLESKLEEQERKVEEQSQQLRVQAKQLKEQAQQLEDKVEVIRNKDEALSKVQEELSSIQKELEEALDEGAKLEIKLRAKLMKEYLEGKALKWRLQEEINRFLANVTVGPYLNLERMLQLL